MTEFVHVLSYTDCDGVTSICGVFRTADAAYEDAEQAARETIREAYDGDAVVIRTTGEVCLGFQEGHSSEFWTVESCRLQDPVAGAATPATGG